MRTIWRLLKLMAAYKWWMVLAVLLGFATVGSNIGLMAASGFLISTAALSEPAMTAVWFSIVAIRFFGIARGGLRYAERYVSHDVTFRLLARLRSWSYERLEPLAPARLIGFKSGDLLARIVADIETLEGFYLRVIAPPAVAVLSAGLSFWLLSRFNLTSGLALLLCLILAGVGVPLLVRQLSRRPGRHLIATRAELNGSLVDGIQGVADLLAFGGEIQHQADARLLSLKLVRLQERLVHIRGLGSGLVVWITNLAVFLVLWLAIPQVSAGQLDGVYLALLALAAIASFEAIVPLPQSFQQLETSRAAAERLFEVVDGEPPVRDEAAGTIQANDSSLTVEQLTFTYPGNRSPTLVDITFSLPPGRHLAIVGPSGGGKSTLLALLLRFWEYKEGSIVLGGNELRRYRPDAVRGMISVVSQRTHLFNGTIKDNLLLACPEAAETQIIEAARTAQIHEFIQGLPQAYDTWIGEQGLRLSAGERQRLAIARAILKDAPLLLLDEPTANLDPLTERQVMQSLRSLMADRSTLMITHRLLDLAAFDQVVVLQAGHIAGRGTHQELLAEKGLYWQLWRRQKQESVLDSLPATAEFHMEVSRA